MGSRTGEPVKNESNECPYIAVSNPYIMDPVERVLARDKTETQARSDTALLNM